MANLRQKYNPFAKSFQLVPDTETLIEKNSINGTFTTTDGKIITVVDGQITSIEET
jgi:hypothetical protein